MYISYIFYLDYIQLPDLKNKTNHPISSKSHHLATTNKALHSLKIGGGGYKTNGNII